MAKAESFLRGLKGLAESEREFAERILDRASQGMTVSQVEKDFMQSSPTLKASLEEALASAPGAAPKAKAPAAPVEMEPDTMNTSVEKADATLRSALDGGPAPAPSVPQTAPKAPGMSGVKKAALATGALGAGGLGAAMFGSQYSPDKPLPPAAQAPAMEDGEPEVPSLDGAGKSGLSTSSSSAEQEASIRPASYAAAPIDSIPKADFPRYARELREAQAAKGELDANAQKKYGQALEKVEAEYADARDSYRQGLEKAQSQADRDRLFTTFASVGESLGQALAQLGAAKQGLKTGQDLSNLKFQGQNWNESFNQITERLKEQNAALKEGRLLSEASAERGASRAEDERKAALRKADEDFRVASGMSKEQWDAALKRESEARRSAEFKAGQENEARKFNAQEEANAQKRVLDERKSEAQAKKLEAGASKESIKASAQNLRQEAKEVQDLIQGLSKLKGEDKDTALAALEGRLEAAGVDPKQLRSSAWLGLSSEKDPEKIAAAGAKLVAGIYERANALEGGAAPSAPKPPTKTIKRALLKQAGYTEEEAKADGYTIVD